jgi:hypothetical protein
LQMSRENGKSRTGLINARVRAMFGRHIRSRGAKGYCPIGDGGPGRMFSREHQAGCLRSHAFIGVWNGSCKFQKIECSKCGPIELDHVSSQTSEAIIEADNCFICLAKAGETCPIDFRKSARVASHISPERGRRNCGSKFGNFAWSKICTVWDSGLCPGCAGTRTGSCQLGGGLSLSKL